MAEGVLGKVIEARTGQGEEGGLPGKAKDTYTVQILNRSPLILNGVALADGEPADPKSTVPGVLSGLSVGPGHVLTIGATTETVEERLGLEAGRPHPRGRPQRGSNILEPGGYGPLRGRVGTGDPPA